MASLEEDTFVAELVTALLELDATATVPLELDAGVTVSLEAGATTELEAGLRAVALLVGVVASELAGLATSPPGPPPINTDELLTPMAGSVIPEELTPVKSVGSPG